MSTNSSLDGSITSEVADPHININESYGSDSVNQYTDNVFESRNEIYARKFNDQSIDINVVDSNMDEAFKQDEDVLDYGDNEFEQNDYSDSFHLSRLGVADSIPNCNKISALLSNMGFSSMSILSSDIDPSTRYFKMYFGSSYR